MKKQNQKLLIYGAFLFTCGTVFAALLILPMLSCSNSYEPESRSANEERFSQSALPTSETPFSHYQTDESHRKTLESLGYVKGPEKPTQPQSNMPGSWLGIPVQKDSKLPQIIVAGNAAELGTSLNRPIGIVRNSHSGVYMSGFGIDRDSTTLAENLHNLDVDEIWVITKLDKTAAPDDDETPGCGAMLAILPQKEKKIPLPLKHTDVKAHILGYIASVNVTQQFHNPYAEKIEAVYVFPLPQNAAVNEFIMTIGDRRIRGIIRKRAEAEQIYAAARRQGYPASLLTQERPNIFTQKVANIEPQKQIDVNIHYFNTLAYLDGWYEFVFPMVESPMSILAVSPTSFSVVPSSSPVASTATATPPSASLARPPAAIIK